MVKIKLWLRLCPKRQKKNYYLVVGDRNFYQRDDDKKYIKIDLLHILH